MHRVRIALVLVAITSLVVPITARAQNKRRPDHRPAPGVAGVDTGFQGKTAYCYLNRGTLTWRIGNDVVERTIHFDRDAGALRTVAVKTMGGAPPIDTVSAFEGDLTVMPARATTPTTLHLDHDWAYIWQSVATPAGGGRLLTIHLQGIRSNDGYEIEALYEVYPGNRPYLAKSLTLINRSPEPVTLREVLYDRWILAASQEKRAAKEMPTALPAAFKSDGPSAGALEEPAQEIGLRAFVADSGGAVTYQNGAIVERWKGAVTAGRVGGRAYTPQAVVFAYRGPAGTGAALSKRFPGVATTASR